MGPKRKSDSSGGGEGKKSKPTADEEGARRSGREKKPVKSYKEDDIIAEQESKPRAGGYTYPNDPPGMKTTAYVCKSPIASPPEATVLPKKADAPKRNSSGEWVFADYANFRPNLSPSEVLKDGAFGGTYFRKIKSFVTKQTHENEHLELPSEWFKGIPQKGIASSIYMPAMNKWGVECGGSLDMWESSGWISAIDPYGWFQWYCRFFSGRRSTDDERQISRWSGVTGPKGRFKSQLANKVALSGRSFDDPNVSPVVRQTLHHWAYCLTEKDVQKAKGK